MSCLRNFTQSSVAVAPFQATRPRGFAQRAWASWTALGAGAFVGLCAPKVYAQSPAPLQVASSGDTATPEPNLEPPPLPPESSPPVFATVGYIASVLWGDHPINAHGVEGTLLWYTHEDLAHAVGIGPIVQWQTDNRFSAGLELTHLLFGLEALYSRRGAADGVADTHGVALNPFVSLGIVHVAGRFLLPLSPAGNTGWGQELGVTFGIKLPILVGGDFWQIGHGRPVRVAGVHTHARLTPQTPSSDALAAFWRHMAEQEHASIAAFNTLALRLLTHGAPLDLIAAAQQAAQEEIAHTRFAQEQAEALQGASCFAPLPALGALTLAQALGDLARETLLDGCIGEAYSAALLRAWATGASPTLSPALARLAEQEQSHADLAWAVLEFCLQKAPAEVAAQLSAWLTLPAPGVAELSEHDVTALALGAPDLPQRRASAQELWAEVTLRLHALLQLDVLAA